MMCTACKSNHKSAEATPIEIVTILASLVIVLLVGVIPALVLFIIYKKSYKVKVEKKDKGDFS